jgi:hypothetical protein
MQETFNILEKHLLIFEKLPKLGRFIVLTLYGKMNMVHCRQSVISIRT